LDYKKHKRILEGKAMVERRIRTLLLLARMENSPHEAKELGLEDVSYIKDGFSAKGKILTTGVKEKNNE
jgi:hypothetical protein